MLSTLMRGRSRKKITAVLGVVVALVAVASVILAQHLHGGSDCNASLYTRSFDGINAIIASAEQMVAADDLEGAFTALDSIDQQVATVRALCSGLVFRSQVEGLEAVIGPIHFGDGVYRTRMITNGDISVKIVPTDTTAENATCDNAAALFELPAGRAIAPNGAEGVFSPVACEAVIQVSAAEPWVLSFEVLSGGEHDHLE